MLHNTLNKILAFTVALFVGDIVNNSLNPVRLAIGTRGYRIQSQTLRIPDRIGFFSPGPPRLQVSEAASFIMLVLHTCLGVIAGACVVFMTRLLGLPNAFKAGAVFLAFVVVQNGIIWVMVAYNPRRAPEYDWGDWKLRKD
jgi:hypothetical protein